MNYENRIKPVADLTFDDLVILTAVGERMGGTAVDYRCLVHDTGLADAQAMRDCLELGATHGLQPAERIAA